MTNHRIIDIKTGNPLMVDDASYEKKHAELCNGIEKILGYCVDSLRDLQQIASSDERLLRSIKWLDQDGFTTTIPVALKSVRRELECSWRGFLRGSRGDNHEIRPDLIQRSPEWYAARCGMLTCSEIENIITPAKLQYADNRTSRWHLYELLAQRVTKYVEPHYISFDMMRGYDDELDAKRYYADNIAPVQDCGFITNDEFGFTLGYSPDGLVGDDGVVEVKGHLQRIHLEILMSGKMPDDCMIQVQGGLLVSRRKWCDFISFCGGMPMSPVRVVADAAVQRAIVLAATTFHEKLDALMTSYNDICSNGLVKMIPTERRPPEKDMFV